MPATLKLFTGECPPTTKSCDDPRFWTVREAFDAATLPRLVRLQRSPGTLAKWRKAVWYWEAAWPDNPPLGAVTSADLTHFPDRLLAGPWAITTNTAANQQLMYVQAIIAAAGLPAVPIGQPLPPQAATRIRRTISPDLISKMYRHCRAATVSGDSDLSPDLVWKTVLVLFWNIGCRRTEGLTMPRSAWHRSPTFPDLASLESPAESPHGWLVFHTPKTRTRKGGLPLVLPVSATLARHLDLLDRAAPRRARLLPVGNHPSTWRKQLNRIQAAAGIDPPFTWHDLRKTANRAFRRCAGRDVARFMLGHSPRGVNEAYYDDLTEDAVAAVSALPQPAAFLN